MCKIAGIVGCNSKDNYSFTNKMSEILNPRGSDGEVR